MKPLTVKVIDVFKDSLRAGPEYIQARDATAWANGAAAALTLLGHRDEAVEVLDILGKAFSAMDDAMVTAPSTDTKQ